MSCLREVPLPENPRILPHAVDVLDDDARRKLPAREGRLVPRNVNIIRRRHVWASGMGSRKIVCEGGMKMGLGLQLLQQYHHRQGNRDTESWGERQGNESLSQGKSRACCERREHGAALHQEIPRATGK